MFYASVHLSRKKQNYSHKEQTSDCQNLREGRELFKSGQLCVLITAFVT